MESSRGNAARVYFTIVSRNTFLMSMASIINLFIIFSVSDLKQLFLWLARPNLTTDTSD
jgi:hypothetical protein